MCKKNSFAMNMLDTHGTSINLLSQPSPIFIQASFHDNLFSFDNDKYKSAAPL